MASRHFRQSWHASLRVPRKPRRRQGRSYRECRSTCSQLELLLRLQKVEHVPTESSRAVESVGHVRLGSGVRDCVDRLVNQRLLDQLLEQALDLRKSSKTVMHLAVPVGGHRERQLLKDGCTFRWAYNAT